MYVYVADVDISLTVDSQHSKPYACLLRPSDGALTGKSKAMIATEYGEDQLKRWRRGFKIRPPPVSSYSLSYPGNDFRRIKYVKDLRVSFMETLNRSIEQRKMQIHRKFPKSESLHDCMKRSVR